MISELSEIVGFFSYSRRDDEHSMGALSRLRARIQSELRLQMGRDFRLWQDTAAIPDGALWQNEINRAIAESLFFIPIITPSAISSSHCSIEFAAFLKREAELGRHDLIFPILYITVEALEDQKEWSQSQLLSVIGSRQYLDWRKYRHHDSSSFEVAQQIEQYCRNIYKALRRPWRTQNEHAEERVREELAEIKRKAEDQLRRKKEAAEAQKRARDQERRKKAETEARARAEEESRSQEAEAKKRSTQETEAKKRAAQEWAFAAAKSSGTVSAFDEFVSKYPESGLAEEARTLRAQLLARQETQRSPTEVVAVVNPAVARDIRRKSDVVAATQRWLGRLQLPQNWRRLWIALLIVVALLVVGGGVSVWLMPPSSPAPASLNQDKPLSLQIEQGLRAKDSFKECLNCPDMIVVPAGSFTMGSPDDEPGRYSDETRVKVAIAQPFAVGKGAVTFDEWDACVADRGCDGYAPPDQGWGRGQRPVVNVSWQDAQAYVRWLSGKTGKTYRLLSEAEREYVTRAGTTTPFWWGTSITPAQANYNGAYVYAGGGAIGMSRAQTVAVLTFAANPWGLYQVHGNIWEWSQDCWNDSNSGNSGDGAARQSGDCKRHVVRGGSWYNSPAFLRAASRGGYPNGNRNDGFGFRVARALRR
jgi:formylglycine-generating enzyme required for sulfatase activity/TolA-binding protein